MRMELKKKRRTTAVMLAALMITSVCVSGCTDGETEEPTDPTEPPTAEQTQEDPTPEQEPEIDETKTMVGYVTEVGYGFVTAWVCENIYSGKCYLKTEYPDKEFEEGDCVLISYEGTPVYQAENTQKPNIEGIQVIDISLYENDCKFEGMISAVERLCDEDGNEYPEGDLRSGWSYRITPLETEPELEFDLTCRLEDAIDYQEQESVTVTYDLDSMEILYIEQDGKIIYAVSSEGSEEDILLREVLLGEAPFIDTKTGESRTLERAESVDSDEGTRTFYYVDLDQDGQKEVILDGAEEPGTAKIFHVIGETVYGYDYETKAMQEVYESGILAGIYDGVKEWYGNIRFTIDAMECRTVASYSSGPQGTGNETYYLGGASIGDGREVSEEEFNAYVGGVAAESVRGIGYTIRNVIYTVPSGKSEGDRLLRSVLLGETSYIDTETGESRMIEEICNDSSPKLTQRLYLVDLDQDGQNEAVLSHGPGQDDAVILHVDGKTVYGYNSGLHGSIFYRNGITATALAGYGYWYSSRYFTTNTMEDQTIARYDYAHRPDVDLLYYIDCTDATDGREVSEEEFYAYIESIAPERIEPVLYCERNVVDAF